MNNRHSTNSNHSSDFTQPPHAIHYITIQTHLGDMILAEQHQALCGAWFTDQRHFSGIQPHWQAQTTALLQTTGEQLSAYFTGRLKVFTLPTQPKGTAFQQQVWEQLQSIPTGQTQSYGAIAQALGKSNAVRAVGAAIGKNPLSIIIPCHRVIAATGALTGYAGGLNRKQWLLAHEKSL